MSFPYFCITAECLRWFIRYNGLALVEDLCRVSRRGRDMRVIANHFDEGVLQDVSQFQNRLVTMFCRTVSGSWREGCRQGLARLHGGFVVLYGYCCVATQRVRKCAIDVFTELWVWSNED